MKYKVVQSAQLECIAGSQPTQLQVTSHSFDMAEGKLLATEQDYNPVENILPFGSCKLQRNQPCMPATTKWQQTSGFDSTAGLSTLLDDSVCMCNIGGVISIKDAGQTTVYEG
jgi:hypothetical protein